MRSGGARLLEIEKLGATIAATGRVFAVVGNV